MSARRDYEVEVPMIDFLAALKSQWRRRRIQPRRKDVNRWLSEFAPISQIESQDIILASYPKSGVTWLQNLLASLLYGIIPEWTPPTMIQDVIVDMHVSPYYRRHRNCQFFKTHSLPESRFRRVVHLVRDGRDVIVSYRHYLSAIWGRPVEFHELVGPIANTWPCRWHEHTEAWLKTPYQAEILRLHYEAMLQDPMPSLRRLCNFVGLQRSEEFLGSVLENAAFDRLQSQEATFTVGGFPSNEKFFRRGVIGSHRDVLPSDALREFLAEA